MRKSKQRSLLANDTRLSNCMFLHQIYVNHGLEIKYIIGQ